MQTYRIAVVAGGGIGPEVVASDLAIMDAAVGVASEFAIEYVAAPAGTATYLECGSQVTGAMLWPQGVSGAW
jgi:isocitrate/isopropylmalate dehydrogenase